MLTVFKSASIPAFAVAFILYFIYAKLILVPSRKGAASMSIRHTTELYRRKDTDLIIIRNP